MKHLAITYCSPINYNDEITLRYKLRNYPIVEKWIDRVGLAQAQYPIDNPGRFYGFGPVDQQIDSSIKEINQCINTINSFEFIIERTLTDINDQDTLNYLHHIFEVYHGLLDQQTHELWLRAPEVVRKSLADLNVLVHRCESVARGANPRHVVTWYGLPKTVSLDIEDYENFEDRITFGTVYLNYVEIGKTLEDLTFDNDRYIADEAFRPFKHYSADFNVRFWTESDQQTAEKISAIKNYYNLHQDFFLEKGYQWGDPRINISNVPLGDLIDIDNVLEKLETRQWVKSVKII